jgi:Fic family protein
LIKNSFAIQSNFYINQLIYIKQQILQSAKNERKRDLRSHKASLSRCATQSVAHEVTNVGHDRSQLANMAKQAQNALEAIDLHVIADRGYFSSEEILQCHEAGITPFVPKCLTSGAKAAGRLDKADFIYETETNKSR